MRSYAPAKPRRQARCSTATLLLALLLVACGNPPPTQALLAPPPASSPAADAPKRELRIFNWDTYIDPAILADFEQQFGVTISYTTFDSDADLIAAMRANPAAYDLIVPSDYAAAELRREGLLAPLHKQHIPNIKNLDPLFVNPAYDPGNRYCLAYQWGTTGIGFNQQTTKRPITGWGDVFDERFTGRVTLLDEPRETLGSILIYLGYSPNTVSSVEIAAARDFLKQHKQRIAAYAPDDGQDALAAGKADVVLEYSGDIFQVMEENADLRFVVPAEGAVVWADNMCISAAAAQQELAEQFMNFILEPTVGAQLSNFIHYSSPNQAALPLINEADRTNPTLYPPPDQRQHLFFMVDVGPAAAKLYAEYWQEVLDDHRAQ